MGGSQPLTHNKNMTNGNTMDCQELLMMVKLFSHYNVFKGSNKLTGFLFICLVNSQWEYP